MAETKWQVEERLPSTIGISHNLSVRNRRTKYLIIPIPRGATDTEELEILQTDKLQFLAFEKPRGEIEINYSVELEPPTPSYDERFIDSCLDRNSALTNVTDEIQMLSDQIISKSIKKDDLSLVKKNVGHLVPRLRYKHPPET